MLMEATISQKKQESLSKLQSRGLIIGSLTAGTLQTNTMLTTEGEYLEDISENVKTCPTLNTNNRYPTNETQVPNNNHMQISNNFMP